MNNHSECFPVCVFVCVHVSAHTYGSQKTSDPLELVIGSCELGLPEDHQIISLALNNHS